MAGGYVKLYLAALAMSPATHHVDHVTCHKHLNVSFHVIMNRSIIRQAVLHRVDHHIALSLQKGLYRLEGLVALLNIMATDGARDINPNYFFRHISTIYKGCFLLLP